MKTKKEIRERIDKLYAQKKAWREVAIEQGKPIKSMQPAFDMMDYAIMHLKSVLGYKVNTSNIYWCVNCEITHKGITCPNCQGSHVYNPIKKEYED